MKNRNSNSQKRDIFFVSRILFVIFCISLLVIPAKRASAGWEQVGEILSRIKAPQFPNKDFNITDYGAVALPPTRQAAVVSLSLRVRS